MLKDATTNDGLLVMRAQPLHNGHIRVISSALCNCERLFIVLGSTQEHGTEKNPFNFIERKMMLKNYFNRRFIPHISEDDPIFWNKIKVIGLPDIFSLRWPTYVLEEIQKKYPDANITKVFGGSVYDCAWFKNLAPHIVDRTEFEYPYISATMIREMLTYRDPRWMTYIPICNWYIVAKKFKSLDMVPDGDQEELWNAE